MIFLQILKNGVEQKVKCYKSGATEKSDGIKDPTMEAFGGSSLLFGEYAVYESDSNALKMAYRWEFGVTWHTFQDKFPLGSLNLDRFYLRSSEWLILRFFAADVMVWGISLIKSAALSTVSLSMKFKHERDNDVLNLGYEPNTYSTYVGPSATESEYSFTVDPDSLDESGAYYFENSDKKIILFLTDSVKIKCTTECPAVTFDLIGTSINYDKNSDGVNLNPDNWITRTKLFFIGNMLYTGFTCNCFYFD